MRVLLIDDSKTMRSIQRGIVEQMGHDEVAEAATGEDAVAEVERFDPELILLDWKMPGLDGLAFVKRYRAAGGTAPIIMVSSVAAKDRVLEAVRAGVTNYVVKPFTPDVLHQRIEETLTRAREEAA